MDTTKKWYLSKTIWANVIIAILGVVSAAYAPAGSFLATYQDQLIVGLFTVVNVIMRAVTKDAIYFW